MTYKGKTVIRMVGRLSGRQGGGFVFLEYADHTAERILLELRIERGRRVIVWKEAEKQSAQFPSIYKDRSATAWMSARQRAAS